MRRVTEKALSQTRFTPAAQQRPAPAKAKVFGVGARVIHPIFGEGMVLTAKPVAQDVLYEIAFENAGTKKLMGNYAKLTSAE